MRYGPILLVLLLVPCISALEIEQGKDTTIVKDTVTYIIKDGAGVQVAEPYSNGIELDGDRLTTIIQGGELIITFTEWSADKAQLTLDSSVPQTLTFKWVRNGSRYYFEDDVGLHLDTYRIGSEIAHISLVRADSGVIEGTDGSVITRSPWLQRNMFFFMLNDQTIKVTHGFALGVVILALLGIISVRMIRRRGT